MTQKCLYVSVDVETTGPVPGIGSMVQLGAVAYVDDGWITPVGELRVNIEEHGDQHPDTMVWWRTLPSRVWDSHRVGVMKLEDAIRQYDAFVRKAMRDHGVTTKPEFVAWPACFDWMWVAHSYARFGMPNPHGYSALCMGSMLRGITGWRGSRSGGDELPAWMTDGLAPHLPWPHDALADARVQGEQFCRMMRHHRVIEMLGVISVLPNEDA